MRTSPLSKALERAFRRRGIAYSLGVRFQSATQTSDAVTVTLEDGKTFEADYLLVAVGRGPATAGLGYEEAGVTLDRGFVDRPTSGCAPASTTSGPSATSFPACSWRTADSSRASSSRRRSRG